MNAITTTAPNQPAMLGFLQRAVSDPNFDTNKFEVVLGAMREEQAKQAEREFYHAMATAQGEMDPIRKDATNPHTRSKYATFEAIDGNLRPVYTRHGFSVSYRTGKTDQAGVVRMICTVAHAGGHSVEAELTAALDNSGAGGRTNKTDVQAVGSTVSYLRRYLLSMVFNVALAGDDDDGESSRKAPAARSWTSQQPAPPRGKLDPVAVEMEGRINRLSTKELDDATNGDEPRPVASDDPPWVEDRKVDPKRERFEKVAARFDERMDGVTDQDSYNAIMGNSGLLAEWAKVRDEAPDLDERMQAKATATLNRIVAQTVEEPA